MADRAPVCGCNNCDYCDAVSIANRSDTRDAENTRRAKRLAIVFFGFCVESDNFDAPDRGEIIKYLHDHVRNPGAVDADEVLRYVRRLLGACK